MTWDWTQVSWTIGEHSTHETNVPVLMLFKIIRNNIPKRSVWPVDWTIKGTSTAAQLAGEEEYIDCISATE